MNPAPTPPQVPDHHPEPAGRANPAIADLVPQVRALMAGIERTLDDSLAILDLTDPGWATRLTSSQGRSRPPLTDFHCYLHLAWIGAAFGVAFEAGLTSRTAISRADDERGLHLVRASETTHLTFEPLPPGYARPPINPHLPVPEQREYVTGWLAAATEWADLLVQIADRQDPTWQDMTLLADGPGATGALVHLWAARRALEDLAHHLGVLDETVTPFPTRARVDRLRYASGSHLDEVDDRPAHGDLRRRTRPTTPAPAPSPEAIALRERRLALGLTQSDIARRMGSAPGQVSMVETGKVALTQAFAHRYRTALDDASHTQPAGASRNTLSAPAAAEAPAQAMSHHHSWAPFPDGPAPLLIRCDDCGLSRLLAEPVAAAAPSDAVAAHTDRPSQPATVDEAGEPGKAAHAHSWTVMFDAGAEPSLVICDCGTHRRVLAT